MGIEGFGLDRAEGAEGGGEVCVGSGACEVGVRGISIYSYISLSTENCRRLLCSSLSSLALAACGLGCTVGPLGGVVTGDEVVLGGILVGY